MSEEVYEGEESLDEVSKENSECPDQSEKEGEMGNNSKDKEGGYKVYPIRWYILFIIWWLNVSNGMVWISFAPVAVATSDYYHITLNTVNMLSLVYFISYVPFGFLSQWILDNMGLHVGILIGGGANLIGSWIRYISCFVTNDMSKVAVLFLGQILASISQPLLLNSPPKMASYWFSPKGRATADMIGTMGNLIGIALGQLVSPILTVYNPPGSTNTSMVDISSFIMNSTLGLGLANITDTPSPTTTDLSTMLLVMAVVATPPAFLAIWIENKPKTPPCVSMEQIESKPFLQNIVVLIHSPQYLVLLFSFGVAVGACQAITTLLEQILHPYGYDDNDAGLIGALLLVSGLISAGVTAPILDKTHRYIEIYVLGYVVATLAFLVFSLLLQLYPYSYGLLAFTTVIVGIGGFAVLPTALEMTVEVTYPVDPGVSCGFLWMSGMIFGIVFLMGGDALRDPVTESMIGAVWLMMGLLLAGVLVSVLLIPFPPVYKKLEKEMNTE